METVFPSLKFSCTASAAALLASDGSAEQAWVPQAEQYVLQADFDFEDGLLVLTGRWKKEFASMSKQSSLSRRDDFFIRVRLQTKEAFDAVKSDGDECFGMLEGYISEDDFFVECTGFLVLEKSRYCMSAPWYTCSLYLYDTTDEYVEISCRLPLYSTGLLN